MPNRHASRQPGSQSDPASQRRSSAAPQADVQGSSAVPHPIQAARKARQTPTALTPADVLQLQRTLGNRATTQLLQRALQPGTIQREDEEEKETGGLTDEAVEGVAELFEETEPDPGGLTDEAVEGVAELFDEKETGLTDEAVEGVGEMFEQAEQGAEAWEKFATSGGERATEEAQEWQGSGVVSGLRGLTDRLEGTLERRRKLGPQQDPTSAVRGERQQRLGMAPYTGGTGLDETRSGLDEMRQGVAVAAAKERVESKSAGLKKELNSARTYEETDFASAEVAQFDLAVAGSDWLAAESLIDQIASISATALSAAEERINKVKPGVKAVKKQKPYHNPPSLTERTEAVERAYSAKDWVGIARQLTALELLVRQAQDFNTRLANVARDSALLENSQQRTNMADWIEKHKTFTWEQVVDSQNSTYTKGSIAHLEDRLLRYTGREQQAKEAEEEKKRQQQEGLIGSNGTIIAEKPVSEFSGEQKTSIQDALNAYDNSTAPNLTHSSGMKWGASFGNRDGDLPGGSNYKEYYVQKRPGDPTYHGSRRLVIHNSSKRVYYSWTHYGDNGQPAFVRIR